MRLVRGEIARRARGAEEQIRQERRKGGPVRFVIRRRRRASRDVYDVYAFAVVFVNVFRFACTERLRSRLGHDSARRHRVSRPARRRVSALFVFVSSRRRFHVFSRKRRRRRVVVVVLRIARVRSRRALQGVLAAQLRAHRGEPVLGVRGFGSSALSLAIRRVGGSLRPGAFLLRASG